LPRGGPLRESLRLALQARPWRFYQQNSGFFNSPIAAVRVTVGFYEMRKWR
jgi:hypothetical protein